MQGVLWGAYVYAQSTNQPGKNVFKKPVKLLVSVVPTQTTAQPMAADAGGGRGDPGGGSGDAGEAIVFDGKTFTVTFTQISGKYWNCPTCDQHEF